MMLVGFPESTRKRLSARRTAQLRWMIQTQRSKYGNSELDYHRFAVAGRQNSVPVITIQNFPLGNPNVFAVAHKIFSSFLSSYTRPHSVNP